MIMTIINDNGRTREVVSISTTDFPEELLVEKDNGNGTVSTEVRRVNVEYVEADFVHPVTGRKWREWYPVEEFRENNPDIRI